MKKILFIVIAIIFAQSVLFAQCNPDLNFTEPGFYPDTITNIPPAVVGEAYSTVINAVIPTEVELQGYNLEVDSVRVFSILNLPSNLSFTANTNSGFWLANTNGCFTIEGLPEIESIGLNELEIVLDYRVTFYGMAYEVPDTLKGYKLIVSNNPISAITKYGEESSTSDNFVGENGNISNTPSISSSGKIFQFPTVQTISVDNITTNSATFNGNIVDNGGLSILQSGFCWNTESNPTISDQTHAGYDQEGEYSANITGLDYNTEYFVKAYAENAKGVSYGDEVSFMTLTAGLPEISTNEVTNIAGTTATCGGSVTSDGGITVTARGVCWSTSQNPTIADSHTTDGSGTGSFTSNISGLTPGTSYFVRAYATNSVGTSYGSQISFTTGTIATLTTNAITNITHNTAISGGNITDDGGLTITSRGVCWSISQNPTITDSKTNDGTGTGTFTSYMGLTTNTTYYLRAYATNSAGTSYGEQRMFTTLTTATITTNTITNITHNTATSGGNITNDGGLSITAQGVCWSTTQNPSTADSKTIDAIGVGTFESNITGLIANTTYYLRAYATNSAGTSYGEQRTFTSLKDVQTRLNEGETPKQIYDSGISIDDLYGKTYQGGLIFYLNINDGTGLIASQSDQSTGVMWGEFGVELVGADGTEIGSGAQNTADIIAGCGATNFAAKICSDLVLNGYSDWFLPSRDELNAMYTNLKQRGFGGFASYLYWSSTENGDPNAWSKFFYNGDLDPYRSKSNSDRVRAIRAF